MPGPTVGRSPAVPGAAADLHAAAVEQRRTMFDQGLLRPNDFRAPAPEDRPPEDLFYKDFKKIKK